MILNNVNEMKDFLEKNNVNKKKYVSNQKTISSLMGQ